MTILSPQVIDQSAQGDLRNPEANYRAIFNAVNDAIFVHDLKTGEILDANQQACEMYGWTIEEIRTLSVGDLSADDPLYSNESALALITKAASEDGPQLFEWRAKDKSGRLFWVEVNLKRSLLNNHEILLAVVRDRSVRKRVMDELRQSERRFEKAFCANPQPMSLTTIADGRYLDVNNSFLSISGYERDEVIGRTSLELNIWESPERREDFIRELLTSGSVCNVEMKFRTKDQNFRTFLSSAEQLQIGGENCVLVASSDITELRQAEELAHQNILALSGKLIQAQEEERRRVARELHDDLSQKMALLSIELEYIYRHANMGEDELRGAVHNLMSDADAIAEDIHRISHQLHPSKLDNLGLVKAVKGFAQEFSAHYQLRIDFREQNVPRRLPPDVSLCAFRIIQESLRNVVKHSGAREAEVFLEKTDSLLKLCVSDSGGGFDTLSDKMINGLGFIAMRERLRSVGGKLSICSQPAGGTRIEAFIPLKEETDGGFLSGIVAESSSRNNSINHEQGFSMSDTTMEGL